MSYKFPFFILAVGILVAGIIPIGLSQVQTEPSMEIDMLNGQTQNPFRIQDHNDVDIFCINPEGHIDCGGTYVIELVYVGEEVYAFSNEQSDLSYTEKMFDHDSVLALWTVDYGTIESQPFIHIGTGFLYGEAQRLSGVTTCGIAMEYYDDTANQWVDQVNGSFSDFTGGVTWTSIGDITTQNFDNDHNAYRIVAYTGTSTSCEIKNVNVYLSVFDHSQITVTRVK